ncbi:MAG: ABC transporter ATP-binding protein [Armatimonadetes bacterium]|nr:ABC transporter ATP-binding protein [Armatimonadota bacterium]
MIELREASLIYQDHEKEIRACDSIDLQLHEREFMGILGPSGSGKSSLLYLMSGLKQPTSGQILVEGRALDGLSDADKASIRLHSFGFVFQYPYLLGYLSALENVTLARPGEDRFEESVHLLTALGLGPKLHRFPHELSGGERQRVCVARALLGSPKVIFADEPTASLDHANGVQVVELLNEHRGHGALVMVTHDPTMLANADRILHLSEGQIEEQRRTQPVS